MKAKPIVIYESCNSSTMMMLHVINLTREGGNVKGFAKLIPKSQGGNSNYEYATYLNFTYTEEYFDKNFKIYKGGDEYKSEWEKPEIIYNVPREGGQTWGGP